MHYLKGVISWSILLCLSFLTQQAYSQEYIVDEPWYGPGVIGSDGGFSDSQLWWRLGQDSGAMVGAYNQDIRYTFAVSTATSANNLLYADWLFPSTPPGTYKVYAHIPAIINQQFDANTIEAGTPQFIPTNSAHYEIYDDNLLLSTRIRNQYSTAITSGSAGWILLGEWTFSSSPKVRLSDKTTDFISTWGRTVIFDSIKLVSENGPLGNFSFGVTNNDCAGTNGSPRLYLDWTPSENAGSYQLYRNIPWSHGGNYLTIQSGNTYFDNSDGLLPNTDYVYRVRAFSAATAETRDSQNVSVRTGSCIPETPDLTVQTPNLNPLNVQVGESFSVTGVVRNQGDATSPTTTLDYYRSNTIGISTSDQYLSSDSVPSLSSNASISKSDSTTIDSVDTYYVGSCVRAVAQESNVNNNCSVGRKVVVTNNAPSQYTINVTQPSNGDIRESSGTLFCGSNCSSQYTEGQSVKLTALPNTQGYEFVSWSGDCSVNNSATCTLTMDSNKSVGAIFQQTTTPKVSLTIQENNADNGTIITSSPTGIACPSNCSGEFPPGTTVTLSLSLGQGQVFSGWGNGCQSQTETSCTVQLNANTQITANFNSNTGPVLSVITAPDYAVAGEPYSVSLSANDVDGDVRFIDWDDNGNGTNPQRVDVGNNQTAQFSTTYANALRDSKITWTATAYDNNGQGGDIFPKEVAIVCRHGDYGTFVGDITHQDTNTRTPFVAPNSPFTKIWKLRNCGTNTWTTSYSLKFQSGDRMNAPRTVNLPHSVAPGESINMSVLMHAPSQAGTHQGFWQLANANGILFPTSQLNKIWVKVQTGTPSKTTLDTQNIKRNGENAEACVAGNPINNATGAQMREHELLKVHGAIPLTFSINYNSLILEEGPLGIGWTHNYAHNAKVFESKESDTSENAQDLIVEWSRNQLNDYRSMPNEENLFKSPQVARQFDKFEKLESGEYQLTTRERINYTFNPIDEATQQLQTPGYLTSVKDANSRGIEISYNDKGLLSRVEEPISGMWLTYEYNELDLLTRVSDPLDREVLLSYDTNRRLVSITNALGIVHSYAYNNKGQTLAHTDSTGVQYFINSHDSDGHVVTQDDASFSNELMRWNFDETSDSEKIITTVTDKIGNSEEYEFNKVYQLLKATDKNGNSVENIYNELGQLSEIKDTKGRITLMTYDDAGNLASVTDPDSNVTLMTYDDQRNMLTRKDALDQTTTYSYDENNNVLSRTDPDDSVTTYLYNTNNQITELTSPEGHKTSFEYQQGRLSKQTDPLGFETTFTYDLAGRLIEQTDPDGNTTKFTLDALDRVITVEDALGNKSYTTYDSRGNVLSETDPNGNVSTKEYDGNANLIKETNALDQETDYEYDGENRLTLVRNARGFASEFKYDKLGRLIEAKDALGHVISMVYDPVGNLLKEIDAKGKVESTHDYDDRDNLVSTLDALNRLSQQSYDSINRVISNTDPLNRITEYRYDALDRLVKVIDAMNGESNQAFDLDGYRTEFSDPNDNVTSEGRDAVGQLTEQVTASNSGIQHEYNGRGLITKTINGRGQVRTMSYDSAGRLIQTIDPDGTIDYTYDDNGNLLEVVEGDKTISRTYDALNRVVSYTNSRDEEIAYTYDEVGNLSVLTYPDRRAVYYGYDANDRLISVRDWADRVTQHEYDPNGRLTKTIRPNGTVLNKIYDDAGQLTSQSDVDADGNVIYQVDYVYDAVGNIIEENASPSLDPQRSIDFIMSYQAGNLLNEVAQNASSANSTTFDADDNLTQLVLSGDSVLLSYDSRNRLLDGVDLQSKYNAENHRIAINSEGVTTTYIVNPEAALSQVLSASADSETTLYVYGRGLQMQENDSSEVFYHYDYRGSTVALSDKNGNVIDRFAYLPFGGVIAQYQGNTQTPFKYNGRDGVMDDGNGLNYMRARFFSLEVRRFVNRDIFIGKLNHPKMLNRFSYVLGQPISLIDPSGNVPVDTFWDVGNVVHDIGRVIKNTCEIAFEGARYLYGYSVGSESIQQSAYQGFKQDSAQLGDAVLDTTIDTGALFIPYVPAGLSKVDKGYSLVAPATKQQLQKKFEKHARDFGVTGNFSPANAQKFNQAIQQHLNASNTEKITGTFRKNIPVNFHTDPNTGLTVIQNIDGSFLSGFKLNPQQLKNVLERGEL